MSSFLYGRYALYQYPLMAEVPKSTEDCETYDLSKLQMTCNVV